MNARIQRLVFNLVKQFGSTGTLSSLVPNGQPITVRMIPSERAADFPFKARATMEALPDRTNRVSMLVGIPAAATLPSPPSGAAAYVDGVDYMKRIFPFGQSFSIGGVRHTVYRTIPLSANDVVLYLELVCDHG